MRGRRGSESLPLRRALTLGAVQGPAELLPISSSAHISLIPWFAGWRMDRLDPGFRKSFEVALHAGTAAALLIGQRRLVAEAARGLDARRGAFLAVSVVPPAVVGYALERPIERRLGGPRTIAAALVAGSVAMLAADRAPRERSHADAGAVDGLALGIAQGVALVPGISRDGAVVAAARLRHFERADASALSRAVALPVILGATARRASRIGRDGIDAAGARALALGAGAAFASTLASLGLLAAGVGDRSPWPFAAYRVGLAAAVLGESRRRQRRRERRPWTRLLESRR